MMSAAKDRVSRAWSWTGSSLRRVFWHRWLLVAAIVVLVAVGGVAAAAYGYDRSQSDVIAKGIRIGGIGVGGLSADAAKAKLRRAFRVLERPVLIRYPHGHLMLSGRQARVKVDVNRLIHRALAISHRSWFLARAWRELTGGHVNRRLAPHVHYSHAVVRSVIHDLRRRIDRDPVNAVLVPSYDRLTVKSGHKGRAVQAPQLRHRLRRVLISRRATRVVDVPIRELDPKVTIDLLQRKNPSYITVDRSNFTLRVYSHLKLVKSYPIAVGQLGLETPAGVYHIQDKEVDPSWHVPLSAWAGSLAGQTIPPGPDDPLKARWLGIFNGAGIHGTEDTSSIGSAASHGCIRMLIPDVIDLYDRVQVGTPIYIGD
jgi:lipoprotein-anchoring transpeptidase ErfK/SrfK